MMRLLVLTIVFSLTLPAVTLAQSADSAPRWTVNPRSRPVSRDRPRDPPPRFTIPPRGTVGLPQIGLPLPPIGLQSPNADQRRRGHRQQGRVQRWPGVVYFNPYFFTPQIVDPRFYDPRYYDPLEQPDEPDRVEPEVVEPAATGRLVLDFEEQPADVQVFVDGYYAGVPDDFGNARGGGALAVGAHRIDLSAPNFEAVTFDVNIAANQTVTYRGSLKPVPKVQKEPGKPTIFYLIPGCYMGNVHPREARLPATCDLKDVVEFRY